MPEREEYRMPSLTRNRVAGKNGIPPAVQLRTEQRVREYASKHCEGKFERIELTFRGLFCYIDVYTKPDVPVGLKPPAGQTREDWLEQLRNTPTHLCRIRYCGSGNLWNFAWYSYAHEKYENSLLITGLPSGTPEEAFETSTLFY
jgi:hypothetical protein